MSFLLLNSSRWSRSPTSRFCTQQRRDTPWRGRCTPATSAPVTLQFTPPSTWPSLWTLTRNASWSRRWRWGGDRRRLPPATHQNGVYFISVPILDVKKSKNAEIICEAFLPLKGSGMCEAQSVQWDYLVDMPYERISFVLLHCRLRMDFFYPYFIYGSCTNIVIITWNIA